MTLIMMYKQEKSSIPVMAGDRVMLHEMPLPMKSRNGVYGHPKYKKSFCMRRKAPKCILKEGVLIGAAGHAPLAIPIVEKEGIQFPKPYLKEGSYKHYVSSIFIEHISSEFEKYYGIKELISRHVSLSTGFLFSIGQECYYMVLIYPGSEREAAVSNTVSEVIYQSETCIISKYKQGMGFYALGYEDATKAAYKYVSELEGKIFFIEPEQILRGAYEKAANATRMCGLGLDIIHG